MLARRAVQPAAAAPPPTIVRPQPPSQRRPPLCERDAVEELQAEVVRLQEERARVARLRLELEEAAAKLERDRAAHEKRKASPRLLLRGAVRACGSGVAACDWVTRCCNQHPLPDCLPAAGRGGPV